nr:hypothetical protein [uncultured Prevotella sp.]
MKRIRIIYTFSSVKLSFGDRRNILWRPLDDLMAVATQSFGDRQKMCKTQFFHHKNGGHCTIRLRRAYHTTQGENIMNDIFVQHLQ